MKVKSGPPEVDGHPPPLIRFSLLVQMGKEDYPYKFKRQQMLQSHLTLSSESMFAV